MAKPLDSDTGFTDRLTDGTYWEKMTLNAIPAAHFYGKATLDDDCKRAIDQCSRFPNLNVRSRKRPSSDKFYDQIKCQFTLRMLAANGNSSEFDKVFNDNHGDAMVYSFHDDTEIIRWVIIDLKVLRQEWNLWMVDPLIEPFFTDQRNSTDQCPFRAFDLTRMKNPKLVVATSSGFF